MAAEEENTELVDQQGQHGHGYGLELVYGMDLGSTRATLAKEIKKLQLHGEILEEAISAPGGALLFEEVGGARRIF